MLNSTAHEEAVLPALLAVSILPSQFGVLPVLLLFRCPVLAELNEAGSVGHFVQLRNVETSVATFSPARFICSARPVFASVHISRLTNLHDKSATSQANKNRLCFNFRSMALLRSSCVLKGKLGGIRPITTVLACIFCLVTCSAQSPLSTSFNTTAGQFPASEVKPWLNTF